MEDKVKETLERLSRAVEKAGLRECQEEHNTNKQQPTQSNVPMSERTSEERNLP